MVKHRLLVGAQVAALACGASLLAGGKAAADVVFPDDVIVQGSLCIGIRLREQRGFRIRYASD